MFSQRGGGSPTPPCSERQPSAPAAAAVRLKAAGSADPSAPGSGGGGRGVGTRTNKLEVGRTQTENLGGEKRCLGVVASFHVQRVLRLSARNENQPDKGNAVFAEAVGSLG